MATSFVIACPECGKQIKVGEELIGKKVRCKGCGNIFPIKAPVPKEKESVSKQKPTPTKGKEPAPAAPVATETPKSESGMDEADDGKAYGVIKEESEAIRCPHCAKEMPSAEAILCLNCGYNTRSRARAKTKAVYGHTQQDIFKWLLPGIICVVRALIIIGLDVLFMVNIKGWMKGGLFHDESSDSYVAGFNPGFFKLYATLISIAICYPLLKFAHKRLVINNRPPERDIVKEK